MRLWHLVFAVVATALALTLAREPAGCVAVVVFIVGLAMLSVATAALMALFQTVGALGAARTFYDGAEAVVATTLVLVTATGVIALLFLAGGLILKVALD